VLTAVTLRLRALWRSTGGAAPLPSDARPERLLAESAAAAAAWEFVSARLQVLHGDVASKRPAMMALTRHRDEMRSQLVGERRRDDGPNTTFQRTSFSNAEWSLNRLMRPPESGGLWLSAAPQSHHKRCGCARRLREAVDNATFNRLQPLRLAAYDGDVFDAFASLVATEWTPCAACGQMGATSRAVLRGYDTSAAPAPGSWCTAGSAPPLLALALDGPPAGEKPAVVHRDRVRVLRLPNGTPVHYRPIALTYLGGGHYICDVDEAKADPTEPPKWVRFDHMEKGGCGVPLAAASIRKGDDRVAWEGKGPYRLSYVVYIRVELGEAPAPPPPAAAGELAGFRHAAGLHSELQAIMPAAERQRDGASLARIEEENAALITDLRAALKKADAADSADSAEAVALPPTGLYATEAHPVAALRCVAQRAACDAEGGGRRRAALVSCGNPSVPAPQLGRGHKGSEEELCRLMPLLREQLQQLQPRPMAPGHAHVIRTLIRRSVFTYALVEPEIAWVLAVGVPDMRAGEWEAQELSTAWHLAVRKSVRAMLQTARDARVTDLVLSDEGCSELANPAASYFGTLCDVLRTEFAGAFRTVGFAIRAGDSARLAVCRKAVARLLHDAPDPSAEEVRPLTEQLEEWLKQRYGWTDTSGEPISVDNVLAAADAADLALGDVRGLAAAAAALRAQGRLDFYKRAGLCRGAQPAGPGLSAGVPQYTPLVPQPGSEALRCCEVLGVGAHLGGGDHCEAAEETADAGGVQGLAKRESERRRLKSGEVAILVAANSGRPGGSCRDHGGRSREVHAKHRTQEEDVVASWLACFPPGDGREDEFERISRAWGLLDPCGTGTQTTQGIDYTAAATPQVYADAWLLGSKEAPVPISTRRSGEAFCTEASDRLDAMLIFCAAPNASRPRPCALASSSMKRTFCAAAADDRDYFERGRAWAVHAALCAARDAGAAIVVMPYIGGGLYAGPHASAPDLERRFVRSVNEMLHPPPGCSQGRMPCGTLVDPLGSNFQAVYIVGRQ